MSFYQVASVGLTVILLVVLGFVWLDLRQAKRELKALDRHNDR